MSRTLLVLAEGETHVDDDLAYLFQLTPTEAYALLSFLETSESLYGTVPSVELAEMAIVDRVGEWVVVDVHDAIPYPRRTLQQASLDGMSVTGRPTIEKVEPVDDPKIRFFPLEAVVRFECTYQGTRYVTDVDAEQLMKVLADAVFEEPLARAIDPKELFGGDDGIGLDATTQDQAGSRTGGSGVDPNPAGQVA